MREFNRIRQRRGVDARMQLEGAQRGMRAATSRELDGLERNLEFLANVGSISPYVGLFGTVWGIMISFQGLASMKEATIATVAPGISEALVATAMGLFAAIPAVWAYNRFATTRRTHGGALRHLQRGVLLDPAAPDPRRLRRAWPPHRPAVPASASSRPRSTSCPTST